MFARSLRGAAPVGALAVGAFWSAAGIAGADKADRGVDGDLQELLERLDSLSARVGSSSGLGNPRATASLSTAAKLHRAAIMVDAVGQRTRAAAEGESSGGGQVALTHGLEERPLPARALCAAA